MATEKIHRTTLTAKEAAEYLGISYWLITQLVRSKFLVLELEREFYLEKKL